MNILRWRRKSKKKIKLKTLVLVVFSLIMTTFAWFAYSKVLDSSLNLHVASWDMKYSIGGESVENPIGIDISTLYPTMEEQAVTVDIKNNGETMVDIEYQVQSVTIAGTSYEIVQEGATNTTQNYISVASAVLSTNVSGERVYKSVITNDISKFPFTIDVEHSAQVVAGGQGYLTITVNWIGDNNELDSEWGYKVGEFLEANPTLPAMSMVLSINSYQVDPEGGEITETLPTTAATAPYLPTGFTKVPGTNLDTGLVITDGSGNEFVWIEVPKSSAIYGADGLNIIEFTDAEYLTIENALNAYTTSYDMGVDQHTSFIGIGVSPSDYKALKEKMLKSVYQNGGFYIGRYETGIESSYRTAPSASDPTEAPVIKANAYPYNWVTCAQAYTVATKVSNSIDYTSSLMFGVQWELVLKYLETKGVSATDIKTDSTSWGNYKNNNYNLTKANTRYLVTSEWQTVSSPYEKFPEEEALLAAGANTSFSRQNIYDLAGNLAEWTFNVIIDSGETLGGFGGDYTVEGTNSAGHMAEYKSAQGFENVGFRVSMFSNIHNGAVGDDGSSIPQQPQPQLPSTTSTTPYLPTGFKYAGTTDLSTGLTIADGLGNEYVWVEVPTNLYDNPSYNTETTTADRKPDSSTDYDDIEYCLHKYTATYRNNTSYKDIHSGNDESTGLTSTQYTTLKQKMLKSVYENGGFYVGKYETGIADTEPDKIDTTHEARTASGDATQTPVIQANAYPYNYVTNKQAQELASTKFNSGGYTTSLMFGVQWDLVLKHLETKEYATESELKSNSTEWGNYTNNTTYTTNANGKYAKSTDSYAWTDGSYNKTASGGVVLSTGASSEFERGGIYDLAGNVWEWTLEYTSHTNSPCASRGGYYDEFGSDSPASYRVNNSTSISGRFSGFRVSLF